MSNITELQSRFNRLKADFDALRREAAELEAKLFPAVVSEGPIDDPATLLKVVQAQHSPDHQLSHDETKTSPYSQIAKMEDILSVVV